MCNQICSVLFASLFILVLTACGGGGGNVPAVVGDTIIETKESESIIDNDEPKPKAKEAIDPTPEVEKTVVITPELPNPCLSNPFGLTCEADFYDDRVSIIMNCLADVTGNLCYQAVTQVCLKFINSSYCNQFASQLNQFKACGGELTSPNCAPTATQICEQYTRSQLCDEIPTYLAKLKVCGYEIESVGCTQIITRECDLNSFDVLCDGDATYLSNREIACAGELDSNRCVPVIERACRLNVFNTLCDGDEIHLSRRETICRKGYTRDADRCVATIARLCDADSLDSVCQGNETYYPMQEIACASEPTSSRCRLTIARVCGADSLNTLCAGNKAYYSAQRKACESERFSDRCASTVARACGGAVINSVNSPLCEGNPIYFAAQKQACTFAGRANRAYCASTIKRVCDATPLDAVCAWSETYFSAQEMICANEPNSARCDITIRRVCKSTPFDTVCQSKNLILRDLPTRPNSHIRSTSDNLPFGKCLFSCYAYYPENINIRPLNNTNIGMATYRGSVSFAEDLTTSNPISINRNIDIIVNFNNNTLTYSGNLAGYASGDTNGYGFGSSPIPFDINGSFTDRGQITGTVVVRDLEGALIGLIGQNEAIGIFSSGGRIYGYNKSGIWTNGNFAGGFTATRQ